MEMVKKELEEGDVKKFDFIQDELDFIKEKANFSDRQLEIFNRLTDKHGRQKIVKIAMEMYISERTVKREIKAIKKKIYKLI